MRNIGPEGETSASRRILAAVNAPTAAPTGNDDGFDLDNSEVLHIHSVITGSITIFDLKLFFWSNLAEQWIAGTTISVSPGDPIASLSHQGAQAVFFQIIAITGAGTIDLWAGVTG
jgi:hypothetical protein